MSAVGLLLSLALGFAQGSQAPPPAAAPAGPTLAFFQDSFVIRDGEKTLRAPLRLPRPQPPMAETFRRNDAFAVWDDRGLTVRKGKTVRSTRLPEIAVSPRVFERDEIRKNLERMKRGERKREANALSGARRIGNDAFFLLRWDDREGKPWLEALVKVDLSSPNPKPALVGRFTGMSLASEAIDDQLKLVAGKLAAVVRHEDSWGLATFDPKSSAFEYRRDGDNLDAYWPRDARTIAFVDRAPYGPVRGGLLELATGTRTELLEVRGRMRFVDGVEPMLAVINDGRRVLLRNVATGAETTLPPSSAVRRSEAGVVVWSPFDRPRRGQLFDPDRWQERAVWAAP